MHTEWIWYVLLVISFFLIMVTSKTQEGLANNKTLYRVQKGSVLWGVCLGLSEYFNTDVTLIRLIFAIGMLFAGMSPLLYIVLWIIMPEKESIGDTKTSKRSSK